MKPLSLLLLTLLIVTIALCAGCGKAREAMQVARTVHDLQDGKATVSNEKGEKTTVETTGKEGEGTVTVTGSDGTTTTQVGADTVKEEDIGLTFYPGATVQQGATSSSTGEKKGQYSAVMLLTEDPFDQVAQFYKDRYADGNTVVSQPNNLMISITSGEKSGKMIMVTSEEGKTRIALHAGTSN